MPVTRWLLKRATAIKRPNPCMLHASPRTFPILGQINLPASYWLLGRLGRASTIKRGALGKDAQLQALETVCIACHGRELGDGT